MLNIYSIKNAIEKAINIMPTTVDISRYKKNIEGWADYEQEPVIINTITGFFDNYVDAYSRNSFSIMDKGNLDLTGGLKFYMVWDEDVDIRKGDIFKLNTKPYRIKSILDLLEMHAVLILDIELTE